MSTTPRGPMTMEPSRSYKDGGQDTSEQVQLISGRLTQLNAARLLLLRTHQPRSLRAKNSEQTCQTRGPCGRGIHDAFAIFTMLHRSHKCGLHTVCRQQMNEGKNFEWPICLEIGPTHSAARSRKLTGSLTVASEC